MKHEYREGPEALARFDKGMTKLFQASKSAAKPKPKPEGKPKVNGKVK